MCSLLPVGSVLSKSTDIACGLFPLWVRSGNDVARTFSMSARNFPQGGTAMFAVLALAGDLGCSMGPGLVGLVSNTVKENGIFMFTGSNINESGLKPGFCCNHLSNSHVGGVAVLKRKNRTV